MVIVVVFISLLYLFNTFASSSDTKKLVRPNLLLIAFDSDGYRGILWFIESLKLFQVFPLVGDIFIYHHESDIAPNKTTSNDGGSYNTYLIHHSAPKPLPDLRKAKVVKHKEHVTEIVSVWENFLRMPQNQRNQDEDVVLSLVFSHGFIPVVTSGFHSILDMFTLNLEVDLFLLGKTKKLTSLSDWHDLSMVAFKRSSSQFHKWFNDFKSVYYYYASNRIAYSMIDPRIAILEAVARNRPRLIVGHFTKDDICSVTTPFDSYFDNNMIDTIKKHAEGMTHGGSSISNKGKENVKGMFHRKGTDYDPSRCHHVYADQFKHTDKSKASSHQVSAIEVYCGVSKSSHNSIDDMKSCVILDLPNQWKKNFEKRITDNLGELGHSSFDNLKKDPVKMMWRGVLRFRDTRNDQPKPFCWEIPSNQKDTLAESNIVGPGKNTPYSHSTYEYYRSHRSNISAVIMTGSDSEAGTIDRRMYMSISKMYYAKRHGYDFLYSTSREFVEYFPSDLFNAFEAPMMQSTYFVGIMTKPLMMLDAMYRYLHREWLIWTDDDVYINTGWLYLPLDVYLADVPDHKVIVLANYRSTFTNVLAIRNNIEGRRLMADWIAITMSGLIQCHGYDQAALGALVALRIGRYSDFPERPLNFTCLYTKDKDLGCNDHNDWSCDFKVERALYRAGFKTIRAPFHNGKISSFTKGCANDVVPEFHIVTETKTRPRFQCGLCTRATEIDSAGHWDGPLGGGNQPILAGNINGWFFNHKAEYLFYELYLKENGCLHIPDVVPPCEQHVLYDHLSKDEHDISLSRDGRHLASLTDGYAFDIDIGTYCKLSNKHILDHQKQKTYMKQYSEFINVVNKIPNEEWKQKYQKFSGGEGRQYDQRHEDTDGQSRRNSIPMDRYDYCETCRRKNDSPFTNIKEVVDCRNKYEELDEVKGGVNID